MKGPYLANIGKNNHVLEKTNIGKKDYVLKKQKKNKLSNFLLNLILNFDFSKSHTCKVKKFKSSEFNVR